MAHYGMSEDLENAFTIANYVFMAIFTFEAIFKLIAMGTTYFKDSWNVFDFIVVCGSLLIFSIS
jgi:voltage-gated sodium channel